MENKKSTGLAIAGGILVLVQVVCKFWIIPMNNYSETFSLIGRALGVVGILLLAVIAYQGFIRRVQTGEITKGDVGKAAVGGVFTAGKNPEDAKSKTYLYMLVFCILLISTIYMFF